MRRVFGFIGHLVGAMVKGFFYTAFVAALLCAAALFFAEPNHRLAVDTSTAFGLVIALLAGVVGAAVALIYHLSHLDSLHHAARRYSEMQAHGQHIPLRLFERR